MHHRHIAVLLAAVVVLFAGTAAYSQYDYPSTPPPSPPPGQPAPAGLSAVKAQAKVAATHAGFAAQGTSVSYAKEHLGHALMCIEGPKGKNVKPSWENPCKGMGNGVLVDLQKIKANPSLLEKARTADASAVAALKSTTLARIKAAAKQVSTLMAQIAK